MPAPAPTSPRSPPIELPGGRLSGSAAPSCVVTPAGSRAQRSTHWHACLQMLRLLQSNHAGSAANSHLSSCSSSKPCRTRAAQEPRWALPAPSVGPPTRPLTVVSGLPQRLHCLTLAAALAPCGSPWCLLQSRRSARSCSLLAMRVPRHTPQSGWTVSALQAAAACQCPCVRSFMLTQQLAGLSDAGAPSNNLLSMLLRSHKQVSVKPFKNTDVTSACLA